MQLTTIGIDIAKNVFHLVICNNAGKVVAKKMLRRHQLLNDLAKRPKAIIAMEACATSHYWAREISALGHEVRLIPAQHVKAFLTGNKNDYNDAHAIVIAARQCHIKPVAIKTVAQQDNQSVHKVRALAVRQRTALCNQIRGLLLEYGVSVKQGVSQLRKTVVSFATTPNGLSEAFSALLGLLYQQLVLLDELINRYTNDIKAQAKHNDCCQRLQTIPGFGPLVASSYFNEVGNGRAYRRGRDVAASLGLVPRQHSTGGKERLLGISKKGNGYLRMLLIQGAKAVVFRAKHKTDKLSQWINRLVATKGHNKACVAYANKMARMAWAVTVSGEGYRVAQ